MPVDMSFFLLSVRFRGTPRLLHPKTIYIASRRVLMSFYAYIINICKLYKKMTSTNENTFSLHFLDLGEVWVDQRFLALPPLLMWILRPSWNVHFSQNVKAGFWTVRGLPHLPANTLHIHVFKKTIRDMSERYG